MRPLGEVAAGEHGWRGNTFGPLSVAARERPIREPITPVREETAQQVAVFAAPPAPDEPHTVPALRRFFELCNQSPNGMYDYAVLERELGATVAWFVINAMGHNRIIEYGTSPRYGWLTDTGQALQRFMLSRDHDTLIGLTCRDPEEEVCYPDTCNCGPNGYEKGRVCINPFWQDDAAQTFLRSRS